jgi:hypothetical protein
MSLAVVGKNKGSGFDAEIGAKDIDNFFLECLFDLGRRSFGSPTHAIN